MKISFDQLDAVVVPELRGGQKNAIIKSFEDSKVKIMHGTLEPGASIGLHQHETNSEIIYILEGNGKVLCDEITELLTAGDCHYCPKGHTHSLINDSEKDLVFFAVIPEQ